jgi:hypothetical protein
MDREKRSQLSDKWLSELSSIRFYRIEIVPFSAVQFGVEFGLVLGEPQEEDDKRHVTVQPWELHGVLPAMGQRRIRHVGKSGSPWWVAGNFILAIAMMP